MKTSARKIIPVCGVLCAVSFSVASASANAATLLSEAFVSGQRLTQGLPSTAAWYSSSNTGVSDASGALVSSSNRHTLAYFTASGAPQALEVGHALSVDFTFSLTAPVTGTGTLRFALLDSGGDRVSADNTGFNNAVFTDYTGYGAFLNLGSATAGSVSERGTAAEQLINGNNAWTSLASGLGTGASFVANQSYSGNLTLSRTADGVIVSVSVSGLAGYSYSYTDTDSPFVAFDTFVIFGATNTGGYTLDNVVIGYAPIPEPASAALLLGGVVLVASFGSRRCLSA